MTAATWRIESRLTVHSEWKPQPGYECMLHEDALVMAEWLSNRHPLGGDAAAEREHRRTRAPGPRREAAAGRGDGAGSQFARGSPR